MAGQRVLVDTGPLVALMNKRDRHHQRFVEYLKFFQGQLVTTWPVLTEVTHHVPVDKAVEIIALVRDGALEVIDLGDAGARVHDLMKKYADRPMDLADASLVWAAEHTGIEQVRLTLPLNSVVLNRSIMRPSSTVPRASYSRTASG